MPLWLSESDACPAACGSVDATAKAGGLATDWHADDYVFRGSIVGPITGTDVAETQKGFNLLGAYPDIDRGVYGFTLDPQNPYRVFWFERWTGTMTGAIKIGSLITLPPTQRKIETPARQLLTDGTAARPCSRPRPPPKARAARAGLRSVRLRLGSAAWGRPPKDEESPALSHQIHITSVIFNPEGKVIYETISPPVDRFEGNTKGAGAVFGLLAGAGLQLPTAVGDAVLVAQQKLNTNLLRGVFGKTWSNEEDIPAWWKSQARGGEANDM